MENLEQTKLNLDDEIEQDLKEITNLDEVNFTLDVDQVPEDFIKREGIDISKNFEHEVLLLKTNLGSGNELLVDAARKSLMKMLENAWIKNIKKDSEISVYTDKNWNDIISIVEPYELWRGWRTILLTWKWNSWKYSIPRVSKWMSLDN